MPHAFARIAFTPAVLAAQERDGTRAGHARAFGDGETTHERLGDDEREFLAAQRSFCIATVSESGWPYVQHRGGPPGFLRVLDERTVGFADFAGNRQFVSVGNVGTNHRVALIVVDYARRGRLKLLGRMKVQPLDDALAARLVVPGYSARPQRAMLIDVAAFDWNCPQHIPQRLDAEDVRDAIAARDARIGELEARLEALSAAGRGTRGS